MLYIKAWQHFQLDLPIQENKLVISHKWGDFLFPFSLVWNPFGFCIIPAPLILMTVPCGALTNHAVRGAAYEKTLALPFLLAMPPPPPCQSGGGYCGPTLHLGVLTCPWGNTVFNHSRKHTWLSPLAALLQTSWWNVLCPLYKYLYHHKEWWNSAFFWADIYIHVDGCEGPSPVAGTW